MSTGTGREDPYDRIGRMLGILPAPAPAPAALPAAPAPREDLAPPLHAPQPTRVNFGEALDYNTADDPHALLGRRWLCRGSLALLIGQTGLGKSSLAVQAAASWALGLDLFGLKPARGPLKSLFIQSENDLGDLGEMARGVFNGLGCTAADRATLADRIEIVTDMSRSGDTFLDSLPDLLQSVQPDIVWLDPLLAYLGADQNSQQAVGQFMRAGLAMAANTFNCGLIAVHHTAKPAKDGRRGGKYDLSYSGSGSAEQINFARAALVLHSDDTGTGVYTLHAGKRGGRAGLRDAAGRETVDVRIQHSESAICWEYATEAEATDDKADEDLATDIAEQCLAAETTSRPEIIAALQKAGGWRTNSNFYRPGRRQHRLLQLVRGAIDRRREGGK